MGLSISDLEGVSPEIGAKLKEMGLNDSDKLLAAAAQPSDRETLAQKLGVDARAVLELADRADLCRIKGIGQIYSDLLEFSGVDTVVELSRRNPENLHATILEKASEHKVQRVPSLGDVQDWIEQAKHLDRAIFY